MSRNRLNKKRNSLPGNTPPPGERHHPWWQWAIIIACLIGFTVVGWTLLSEDREKARALQLLRQGHFKEAEPLLKQVLERSPDDVQALQAMALGLHQSGAHPAEVETYVSRWCELEPTQVEPYLLSMHVNRELKRTREAVDDALHVLRLQPDNVEVRKKAASLLVASGQPSEAKKQCAECLKQKPNDPDVLLLLARIASLQGDHQQAEKQVDVVLRAQPDNTNAILQKALCLQERKEYHEAIPLLERVLSLNPDRTMARIAGYQLSQAYARIDQPEKAKELFNELQQKDQLERLILESKQEPDNLALSCKLASHLFKSGQSADAVQVLKGVLSRKATCRQAHLLLAQHYEDQGNVTLAEQHRQQANQDR